ncbi:hypothetical protein OHA25_20015 [Nonomuraea sp. NBC_00507]|uniref:hypothetical protein n=1 Tax=Nonomuraea sp. NBC_00507 TaxID=2976002 RepID=UPI002E19ED50
MQQALNFRDQLFINLRHYPFNDHSTHGYRWIDLKRFELLSPSCDDTLLLDALIKHDQFRDDYAGGGVDPLGTRHGPYWLSNITTDAYEPVDEMTAIDVLRSWASQYGGLPRQVEEVLNHEVYALIRAATSRYRLKGLGRSEFHDWGGVHTEFHELIVVDRASRNLTLIIAADD